MSAPDTGMVWEMLGDARPNGDTVIAVEAPSTGVKAWKLRVAPGGTAMTVIRNVTLSSGIAEPHGPSHGGAAGHYLIVWHQGSGAATEIRGAVIDANLSVLQSSFSIAPAGNWRHDAFVDGDGDRWVVSFEKGVLNNQLACRTVTWNETMGAAVVGPEVTVLTTPNRVDLDGVAWGGDSYVLAYRRVFGSQNSVPLYNAFIGSIDPFSCLDCEGEILVEPQVATTSHESVAFATEHSGSPGGGTHGLAVWQTVGNPGIWWLTGRWTYASRFRALDGIVNDLGGGCGQGGQALGSCAIAGNPAFDHRLQNATPNVPALLLLGSRTLGFPCGPCSLVADPTTAYPVASVTDSYGSAEIRTPIPPSAALIGASLVDQWLTLAPQPTCNLFSVDFSNAIRITIE